MRQELRSELLAMAEEDDRTRKELVADGSLFEHPEGYHPRMERVHRKNARRLKEILDTHGWPGRSLVGPDGAEAAWLVLQHAIGNPELQRTALPLLREATSEGDVDPRHVAHLEDRIAFFEDRPQPYGTQLDWDASGELSPHPIADEDTVDERRAEVGLPPIDTDVRRARARAAEEGETPPDDPAAYRARRRAWMEEVGW